MRAPRVAHCVAREMYDVIVDRPAVQVCVGAVVVRVARRVVGQHEVQVAAVASRAQRVPMVAEQHAEEREAESELSARDRLQQRARDGDGDGVAGAGSLGSQSHEAQPPGRSTLCQPRLIRQALPAP